MLKVKLMGVVCLSMGLFACAPADMPSRARTDVFPAVADVGQRATQVAVPRLNVVGYSIAVPNDLLVSEADVYLPNANIVWHGEPAGDRHAQVLAMFAAAMERGTAPMTAGKPVKINIEVTKFHALTPKTRATFGGNFAMHFMYSVMDAETGRIIDGPRMIVADTPASGGRKALREEAEGITQKTVIVGRLVEVFQEELANFGIPKGPPLTSRDAFSPFDLTLAD